VKPRELVRVVVEECWPGLAGLDRLQEFVAPDYVHHTPFGDLDFEQFRSGLAYVESVFTNRAYRAEHVLVEGDLAAAYVSWTATRVADGSAVEGRGAYHCRIAEGLVAEDWDVFFPTS